MQMISEGDEDGSGEIDFFEFCNLMAKLARNSCREEELISVFGEFDKNNDQTIDWRDLHEVFVELGYEASDEDCKLLVQLYDADKDGKLSFEEFVLSIMA